MATAMIGPKFYAWDNDGKPLAFGKLYTYEARTNVPKATYQSEDSAVANTNPVILNGEGYADVYLDGSYKMVLKDIDDVEVWSADPVTNSSADEWIHEMTANYVGPSAFSVAGNFTAIFDKYRKIRIDSNTPTYLYGAVSDSSYAGGFTTVTTDAVIVPTGIVKVASSIVGFNSSPANLSIETVAVANNTPLENVTLLALGNVSGVNYFYDTALEKTFYSINALTGLLTATGTNIDGVRTITVDSVQYVIYSTDIKETFDSSYGYAVSQLAAGNKDKVGMIYKGQTITPFDFLVYPNTGQIFSRGISTGTTTGDFNPVTGVATGLSEPLVEVQSATSSRVSLIESQLNKSVNINITADEDLTLTTDQNKYGRVVVSDTGVILTANRNIIIDNTEKNILVINKTNRTLKVKTAAGTGFFIQKNAKANLRCDGVNVYTGVGVREVVQPIGDYSSGSFSYPNGLSQIDYENLICTGGGGAADYRNSAQIGDLGIADDPTTWSLIVSMGSSGTTVQILFRYETATQFAFSSSSGGGVAKYVIGWLKEGVTI